MMFNGKTSPLLPTKRVLVDLPLTTLAIINGILWIHRTGAPWDDLPARYGSRGTVSSRLPLALPRHLARDPESLADH